MNPPADALPPIAVDLLRPEDAPGVAALFCAVYGDHYPVRDYYEPETLIAANREGRIISSVARTPEGRVVGHNALFNHVPNPKTYELGAGLVLPEFRMGNLFERMLANCIQVGGPRFGVEMIWGESVCNHVYTQRAAQRMRYLVMAFEVELMPAATYAKEGSAPGRVSTTQQFQTQIPHPHAIHPPRRYADQLSELYAEFDDQRDFMTADAPLPADLETRLDVHVHDFAQVVRIAIMQAGADLEAALTAAESEASARGVVVFQAWIDLGQPWAGAVCEVLRSHGYFLGGALPRWFDSDGMLMQKLTNPPRWDDIVVGFPRIQRVLDLVRADYESLA